MPDKSFLAGAAEPVIRISDSRRKFVDEKACTEYITRMARLNAEPYRLPKSWHAAGEITENQFNGMQFFTIGDPCAELKVLYLHGGSYFAPPNFFHWDMLIRLAKLSGALIYAPLYPRAPIHTCSTAYARLRDFYAKYFSSEERFCIMGDSAGGGLALGFSQTLAAEGLRCPEKLVLLSPWLDVSMDNPEMCEYEPCDPVLGIYGLRRMGKLWAGNLDVHDPKVSPIYGNFEGVGEITVFVGTREIFYPEVMRFCEILKERGIEHKLVVGEQMNHVWVTYPMREGRAAIEEIAEILKS